MSALMLPTGDRVTREQVCAIPTPPRTHTYNPVSYADAIDILLWVAADYLKADLISEEYGLNKAGTQLFAHFSFDVGDIDGGLAIGLRQSLNKTTALGVVIGKHVTICSNLILAGELKMVRKNTANVYADYRRLLEEQLATAYEHYVALDKELVQWKSLEITERQGYELIGVAMGKANILSATQGSVALQDWQTPRHSCFASRDVYSLYNCFTEGLKKGAPSHLADRHLAAHNFMRSEALDLTDAAWAM